MFDAVEIWFEYPFKIQGWWRFRRGIEDIHNLLEKCEVSRSPVLKKFNIPADLDIFELVYELAVDELRASEDILWFGFYPFENYGLHSYLSADRPHMVISCRKRELEIKDPQISFPALIDKLPGFDPKKINVRSRMRLFSSGFGVLRIKVHPTTSEGFKIREQELLKGAEEQPLFSTTNTDDPFKGYTEYKLDSDKILDLDNQQIYINPDLREGWYNLYQKYLSSSITNLSKEDINRLKEQLCIFDSVKFPKNDIQTSGRATTTIWVKNQRVGNLVLRNNWCALEGKKEKIIIGRSIPDVHLADLCRVEGRIKQLISELKNGDIPSELKDVFIKNNIDLPNPPLVDGADLSGWDIGKENKNLYLIVHFEKSNILRVYKEKCESIGFTQLFDISPQDKKKLKGLIDGLNKKIISPDLKDVFEENNVDLPDHPLVTATKLSGWEVGDACGNKYLIVHFEESNNLKIYRREGIYGGKWALFNHLISNATANSVGGGLGLARNLLELSDERTDINDTLSFEDIVELTNLDRGISGWGNEPRFDTVFDGKNIFFYDYFRWEVEQLLEKLKKGLPPYLEEIKQVIDKKLKKYPNKKIVVLHQQIGNLDFSKLEDDVSLEKQKEKIRDDVGLLRMKRDEKNKVRRLLLCIFEIKKLEYLLKNKWNIDDCLYHTSRVNRDTQSPRIYPYVITLIRAPLNVGDIGDFKRFIGLDYIDYESDRKRLVSEVKEAQVRIHAYPVRVSNLNVAQQINDLKLLDRSKLVRLRDYGKLRENLSNIARVLMRTKGSDLSVDNSPTREQLENLSYIDSLYMAFDTRSTLLTYYCPLYLGAFDFYYPKNDEIYMLHRLKSYLEEVLLILETQRILWYSYNYYNKVINDEIMDVDFALKKSIEELDRERIEDPLKSFRNVVQKAEDKLVELVGSVNEPISVKGSSLFVPLIKRSSKMFRIDELYQTLMDKHQRLDLSIDHFGEHLHEHTDLHMTDNIQSNQLSMEMLESTAVAFIATEILLEANIFEHNIVFYGLFTIATFWFFWPVISLVRTALSRFGEKDIEVSNGFEWTLHCVRNCGIFLGPVSVLSILFYTKGAETVIWLAGWLFSQPMGWLLNLGFSEEMVSGFIVGLAVFLLNLGFSEGFFPKLAFVFFILMVFVQFLVYLYWGYFGIHYHGVRNKINELKTENPKKSKKGLNQ